MGYIQNVGVTLINNGLVNYRSGNKVKQRLNFLLKIKSLVNLFKGCGCGQSPQNFMLSQILIAKRLAVWRLEHNSESRCDSNKKRYSYNLCRHCVAMTAHYFDYSFLKAVACFFKLSFSTQTAKLFAPTNLL